MEYGQSLESETRRMGITLEWMGEKIDLDLVFRPYQSLLYKIEGGKAEAMDIYFDPAVPEVRQRPEGYQAPWLIH